MLTEPYRNRAILEEYKNIIPVGWNLINLHEADRCWCVYFVESILIPEAIMFVICIDTIDLNSLTHWGSLGITSDLYVNRIVPFLREQLSCRRPE